MNAIRYALPVLIFFVLVGCTIVDGNSIVTGTEKDPIPADQVRIYRIAPDSYEEIAIVSASAGHDFKKGSALMNSTIQRLKEEAAKVGANGVLLTEIDERDAPRTTTSTGTATARANDGSSVYASGNTVSVNRGDAYTRIRGLAIYVP